MEPLTLSVLRQYRKSWKVVDSPDSYLPDSGKKITFKGKEYREVGRFPSVDIDIVSRFWMVLPILLLIDLVLSPYWIYRLVRRKYGRA